jgi:hypothetical protein
MLADFGFRARHITTSRFGSQWFGGAGVPPAVLNFSRSVKNRLPLLHRDKQDAGATNSTASSNSKCLS